MSQYPTALLAASASAPEKWTVLPYDEFQALTDDLRLVLNGQDLPEPLKTVSRGVLPDQPVVLRTTAVAYAVDLLGHGQPRYSHAALKHRLYAAEAAGLATMRLLDLEARDLAVDARANYVPLLEHLPDEQQVAETQSLGDKVVQRWYPLYDSYVNVPTEAVRRTLEDLQLTRLDPPPGSETPGQLMGKSFTRSRTYLTVVDGDAHAVLRDAHAVLFDGAFKMSAAPQPQAPAPEAEAPAETDFSAGYFRPVEATTASFDEVVRALQARRPITVNGEPYRSVAESGKPPRSVLDSLLPLRPYDPSALRPRAEAAAAEVPLLTAPTYTDGFDYAEFRRGIDHADAEILSSLRAANLGVLGTPSSGTAQAAERADFLGRLGGGVYTVDPAVQQAADAAAEAEVERERQRAEDAQALMDAVARMAYEGRHWKKTVLSAATARFVAQQIGTESALDAHPGWSRVEGTRWSEYWELPVRDVYAAWCRTVLEQPMPLHPQEPAPEPPKPRRPKPKRPVPEAPKLEGLTGPLTVTVRNGHIHVAGEYDEAVTRMIELRVKDMLVAAMQPESAATAAADLRLRLSAELSRALRAMSGYALTEGDVLAAARQAVAEVMDHA